ncbi:hypothetical protein KKG58_05695 [Patescibacteria group bacterium]|nr:hypothetical protein [Patescibacteria group bacterium]
MSKLSSSLPGVHDVSSLETIGRRSIPHSAKSAFLSLFMHQNRKDGLITEKQRLEKKRKQIDQKLAVIKKEMNRLFQIAQKQEKNNPEPVQKNKAGKTVISY